MTGFIDKREWLTYDDVLLVPQYSDIPSRKQIDLTSGKLGLRVPFISANMDTITEENMAIAMHNAGGLGVIHRFLGPKRLYQIIKRVKAAGAIPVVSIGINGDSDELLDVALKNKVTHFCIDVAHGHHKGVIDRIKQIRSLFENNPIGPEDFVKSKPIIIAGNVATGLGLVDLAEAGADIIKVGIGPGSHCTTRIVTGHGVPQLSAIMDCARYSRDLGVEIIADGGIRNSGDIAKAIAAGADYVMLGRILAGCDETPGDVCYLDGNKVKVYRGMASFEAQTDRGKRRAPEGVASYANITGPTQDKVAELADGLCSAFSYTAARDTKTFKENAVFVRVTHNSYIEGTPHGAR